MTLQFLMPRDNLRFNCVDPVFLHEYKAASAVGTVYLSNETEPKLSHVAFAQENQPLMYHGWMLTPQHYTALYNKCASLGYDLTNTPDQYFGCHYFDNWYPFISEFTPRSIIIERQNLRSMLDATLAFQRKIDKPLFIKDSVKSLKHQWKEACFIPKDANPLQVAKILATFCEIKKQYNDFQGSLIVREYVPLIQIGVHEISGMPVSNELRGFILNGKLLYACPYWDEDKYKFKKSKFPLWLFEQIATKIYSCTKSKFFTIDIGQLADGSWKCIEVGDGQVSSVPENAELTHFFKEVSANYKLK